MARGETVVTFDFEFTYSSGGQFVSTNRIVVRAPGLSLLDVHGTMKSFTSQAQRGMMEFIIKAQQARKDLPADEDEQGEQIEPDVLELMAMGLPSEDYPRFLSYVKKALSNRVSLAYVGDPTAPHPITDEVWLDIEKHGGIDAFYTIARAFTGFFFSGPSPQTSPPKNGTDASPISASATKAPLPMSRRATTRSSTS